jgi:hypothetical protein
LKSNNKRVNSVKAINEFRIGRLKNTFRILSDTFRGDWSQIQPAFSTCAGLINIIDFKETVLDVIYDIKPILEITKEWMQEDLYIPLGEELTSDLQQEACSQPNSNCTYLKKVCINNF